MGHAGRVGCICELAGARVAVERARAGAVDEVQVEPPIAIVVEKGRARAHGLHGVLLPLSPILMAKGDPGLDRHLNELHLGAAQPGQQARQSEGAPRHECSESALASLAPRPATMLRIIWATSPKPLYATAATMP